MIVALLFFGLILVISGYKGTQGQLASLFASEFTGAGNFFYFIVGIFFLGALGYYPPLRNTSRMLIGLTLLVLILSNGGFWQQLMSAINSPQSATAPAPAGVPAPVNVSDAGKTISAGVAAKVTSLAADNVLGSSAGGAAGAIGGLIGAFL